jgi:N-acetylmuramoyl-L-alanine amidase
MIFISAGHHFNPNGADPGACANNVREADLTRELRDLITQELTRIGAKFITDKDHETLSQYMARIKPGAGSVVCEIHFNAGSEKATGIETLVREGATGTERLCADEINKAGIAACGMYNRGVKSEKDSHRGRLGILHTGAGISVLPEICFITNMDDLIRYRKFKGDLAVRIAALLKKYDDKTV